MEYEIAVDPAGFGPAINRFLGTVRALMSLAL